MLISTGSNVSPPIGAQIRLHAGRFLSLKRLPLYRGFFRNRYPVFRALMR
jgi:hypothetical protein